MLGPSVALQGAAGLGGVEGGVTEQWGARRVFVFHLEGLFELGFVQPEGLRPGAAAAGGVAHLLLAGLAGVTSWVARLLAAVAAVGVLRVWRRPVNDLPRWRRQGRRGQAAAVAQDSFPGLVEAGSAFNLRGRRGKEREVGIKKRKWGDVSERKYES